MARAGRHQIKGATTADVIKDTGIGKQRLYYLEQKGFIQPRHVSVGEKEFRYYSPLDVEKVRAIKRRLDRGLRYRPAMQQALAEVKRHRSR